MRPIFTIHAGEYLVGSAIERLFPNVRVWIPSTDDGIDLLITDARCRKSVSLQVKFSKDYLGDVVKAELAGGVKSGGWWNFDLSKIEQSAADLWVLALYRFLRRDFDFVIIKPKTLAAMLSNLNPGRQKIPSYLWVTSNDCCFETRGLNKTAQKAIAEGLYSNRARDLTKYLNNWGALETLNEAGEKR